MDENSALEIIVKICGLVLILSGLIMLFSSSSLTMAFGIILIGIGWFLFRKFRVEEK